MIRGGRDQRGARPEETRLSHLLLLRSLQHLPGAAHQLLLVCDLLLQNGHLHLQLVDQALLLVDLGVQRAVLPPQREELLLQTLALLDTALGNELLLSPEGPEALEGSWSRGQAQLGV